MNWEKINGWNSPAIYDLYSRMVKKFNNAVFVEIGTWKGRSTVYMAEEIRKHKKKISFFAIDFFEEYHLQDSLTKSGPHIYDEYIANIEPVKKYITTIKGNSHIVYEEFNDESIDFLFIDGNHDYEAVKKDIQLWYPKVKNGGIISGHDYDWDTVKQAVDEYFDSVEVIVAEGGYVWIANK